VRLVRIQTRLNLLSNCRGSSTPIGFESGGPGRSPFSLLPLRITKD
jgi:hypothetical protein